MRKGMYSTAIFDIKDAVFWWDTWYKHNFCLLARDRLRAPQILKYCTIKTKIRRIPIMILHFKILHHGECLVDNKLWTIGKASVSFFYVTTCFVFIWYVILNPLVRKNNDVLPVFNHWLFSIMIPLHVDCCSLFHCEIYYFNWIIDWLSHIPCFVKQHPVCAVV